MPVECKVNRRKIHGLFRKSMQTVLQCRQIRLCGSFKLGLLYCRKLLYGVDGLSDNILKFIQCNYLPEYKSFLQHKAGSHIKPTP